MKLAPPFIDEEAGSLNPLLVISHTARRKETFLHLPDTVLGD